VNGVDYHFIDESTFETRAKMGAFLEHANVYGRRYGTLQESVVAQLQSGRDVLLNIDVQGAATVRELACKEPWLERGLVTLFMTPPNLEELEQRLRGRGTDSEEVMGRRLAEARREIAVADSFDYLILSGTREMDLQRAEAIYQAERLRMTRVKPAWKEAFR
jgi:guanylate kinase